MQLYINDLNEIPYILQKFVISKINRRINFYAFA